MPGPALIDQGALEANFPPEHVRQVFCDDGSGQPGPRLATACLRATRRAESILLRAWPLDSIPKLFEEDEAVVAEACRLAMAYGVEGKPVWSGPDGPYQGLEKAALAALRDLADAQQRSRAESEGAGQNPSIDAGRIRTVNSPPFMFAPSASRPRRGGY